MPAAENSWAAQVLPPQALRLPPSFPTSRKPLRLLLVSSILRNRLGSVSELKLNEPKNVAYPDDDAPGVLLKLGKRVPGGVGADGDIVGFTTTCPHKGFPLNYSAADKTMNCPGHYSRFDCEAGGQQTWGHATQNLPQYVLRVDDKGDIFAEGVDELLYGRLSNVL